MPARESRITHLSRCDDILSVRIARPEGYLHRPGQWSRFTIETDSGAQSHTFSHCEAPGEPDIEITTRVSDTAYKQALAAMSPGDAVTIQGPGGRFGLPSDARSAAVLVGGVGITPICSILRDAVRRGVAFDDFVIFYGNRSQRCVAYLDELKSLSAVGVRLIEVYEHAPEGRLTETGLIDAALVERHLDPHDGRPVLVSGPPVMVEAMSRVLDELGVAEDRRVIERFGV